MATTRTANVNADAWYMQDAANSWGNGGGPRLSVGFVSFGSGWTNRFAIKIPRGTLFDGIQSAGSITAFQIKLRADNDCVDIGGTVKFYLERATTSMGENSEDRDCIQSTAGTTGVQRWPGPTRTTTDRAEYQGSPVSGDWITVNALALGQWWYNNPSVTELVLVAVASDGAGGYAESTAARRFTCYSRHTTSIPYASMTFNEDVAPNIPNTLTPADNALVATTSGTSITVSGKYDHPQGKSGTAAQFALYPTSATDAVPGSPLVDQLVTATVAQGGTKSNTFLSQTSGTARKWRMRFAYNGLWGPWSLLQTVTPVYLPGTPAQPYVTPNSLTPDFFASLVSSKPGDYITAAEVNVWLDPAQGQTITKWASGQVAIGGSPTRVQMTYGGSALAFDTQYRWQVRLANSDGVWSAWTGNQYFTPTAQLGPNISPGDTSTLQTTKTPTFTLTRPGGGNFDQYRMRWYNEAGTLLSDTGVVSITSAASTNVVTPAGLWDWGQQPQVDAAIRNTGDATIGPYADKRTVRINAQPGSPYPLSVTAGAQITPTATQQAIVRSDGVVVTDADTYGPNGSVPFRDTDLDLGYAELPSLREVEVSQTGGTLVARLVRKMYARHDVQRLGGIHSFDQEGTLVPTTQGWVAGTACALSWSTTSVVAEALRLAFTALATATTSTQTFASGLNSGSLYTDLSAVTNLRVYTRKSAAVTGLAVKLRFTFSGNSANFAEFDVTPSATNTWEAKVMVRASPATTGGTVNWAQVSGLELRVSHTAGSNQTFDVFVDELRAEAWAAETTRRVRARYDDLAAVRSAYSDYLQVRQSAAPTLSSVTPANAATVTDPTPTIAWSYASAGSKAQGAYRVTASVAGDTKYDSGWVTSTATSVTLPAGTLPNASTVAWTLDVRDSDGLLATQIARTFTTNFTQPPALTGLTLTPDDDAMAILVQWTASGLSAGEFQRYIIRARSGGGQFEQVGVVTAQASPSFTYYGAPHNTDVIVQVTQDNGWLESNPVEASTSLDVEGTWRLDPAAMRLRYVQPNSQQHSPKVEDAEYAPLGADAATVVTLGDWGTEGRLQLRVPPEDASVVAQLEQDRRLGTVVLLKTGKGLSAYVKWREVTVTDDEAGWTNVTLAYTQVAASLAGF